MTVKSMTDIAYEILSSKKRSILFSKLWEEVSKKSGAQIDKVSQFYSDLTLDSRFASLKENKWDLVERRKFEESHIDLSEIELEEDDIETIDDDDMQTTIKDEDRY